MDTHHIALAVFSAALVGAQALDYISTTKFLANGTGYEANPIQAFIQKTLGKWWWLSKLIFVPVLYLAWFVFPIVEALIVLAVLMFIYGIVVLLNFQIADGEDADI